MGRGQKKHDLVKVAAEFFHKMRNVDSHERHENADGIGSQSVSRPNPNKRTSIKK